MLSYCISNSTAEYDRTSHQKTRSRRFPQLSTTRDIVVMFPVLWDLVCFFPPHCASQFIHIKTCSSDLTTMSTFHSLVSHVVLYFILVGQCALYTLLNAIHKLISGRSRHCPNKNGIAKKRWSIATDWFNSPALSFHFCCLAYLLMFIILSGRNDSLQYGLPVILFSSTLRHSLPSLFLHHSCW